MKQSPKRKRQRKPSGVRILRDLPNTDGEIRAAICGSRSEAEAFIRQGEAVSVRGSRGWLRVWRDDDGTWQCQLEIGVGETIAAALYEHAAAAAAWVKEQWPKLYH